MGLRRIGGGKRGEVGTGIGGSYRGIYLVAGPKPYPNSLDRIAEEALRKRLCFVLRL